MIKLCKNKHWKINKEYNIDKILYLLIDRSTKINSYYNDFIWENTKGQFHRNYDLPCYINCFSYVEWWNNGKRNRMINSTVGQKFYFNNGKQYENIM